MLQRSLLAASTARAAMRFRIAAPVSSSAAALSSSPAAAASCSLPLLRAFHARACVSAPKDGANPSKREASNKGMRAKQAAKGEESSAAAPAAPAAPATLDSAAAAAAASAGSAEKSASEKAAARSSKVSSSKREESAAARAARQAKQRVREGRAVARRLAQQQDNVIEKEVPLMDLTGLTPGQNKFTNVLNYMREASIPEPLIKDLELIGDLATGSTAEILSGKLANLRAKYGRNDLDTGSTEVQVAMLTERLKGYDRHMITHKSDIAGRRGFLAVWHRRRKLLKYLRRTRYETYAYMMQELQLSEADIDNVGLDRTSGTQTMRIKRD